MIYNKCAIIVHVYKEKFNELEEMSIKNLFSKLGNKYHIYCICPILLDLSYYKQTFNFYKYLRLNNIYFSYPEGYNYMMTNIDFYKRFIDYEYIFVHQADAYIFNDDLEYWINKNYHIIGPSIFVNYTTYHDLIYNNIFVGGITLRNVKYCINLLSANRYNILYDKSFKQSDKFYPICFSHEDHFFSSHKIALYNFNFISNREMCNFAIVQMEYYDMLLSMIIINNYSLPFAYHSNAGFKRDLTLLRKYNFI